MEEQKALEELRRDESSRGAFLKMVGGAGAAGALGIFLAACGDDEDEDKAAATVRRIEAAWIVWFSVFFLLAQRSRS